MNFNERIRALRGEMTQADFANRAGINVNTLRNYERGDSIPNLEVAASICRYFSVSSDWLMLGEGPMRRGDSAPDTTPSPAQPPMPPGPPIEDDFKMTEMVTMTVEVLESETIYRTALASNIRAFHQAVRSERTLARLEERIAVLEAREDRWAQIDARMAELEKENVELKRRLERQDENTAKAVGADG